MGTMHDRYADFEALRTRALALRAAGHSRRAIRDRLHVDNNDLLARLLDGSAPPAWAGHRPGRRDDLRARARELRAEGLTYDRIQLELGCSKSSISLRVRDLPKPEPHRTLHLRWLGLLGVLRERMRFRVSIHESADVAEAEGFWAEVAGIAPETLRKATLKKHRPRTVRRNVGSGHHGCSVVHVTKSADLYRRTEGARCGIVRAATRTG